jgi:hypothetical protein
VLLQPNTALDLEIKSFTGTLRRCFRGAGWEAVSYYAADAWSAANRADASWPEVEARVRAEWDATVAVTRLRQVETSHLVKSPSAGPLAS